MNNGGVVFSLEHGRLYFSKDGWIKGFKELVLVFSLGCLDIVKTKVADRTLTVNRIYALNNVYGIYLTVSRSTK